MKLNSSYAAAPTKTVTAGGTKFAYRELGPTGGIPVVFFVPLAANLDNWDPRIVDPIARNRHVIAFDNTGVGASSGKVPAAVEEAATGAYTFIRALGFDTVDILGFSLGGMIAQDLTLAHPELVRRLILTGTGPRGGKDIDRVARVTFYDIVCATLTRSDPRQYLFSRLNERTVVRDKNIAITAVRSQLSAIKKYGRTCTVEKLVRRKAVR